MDFQRIVTTRNFLVHNEIKEEWKRKLIKGDKLDLYSNKLNIIFQGLLLFLYTGNNDKISERIEKPGRNKAAIGYKTI